MKRMYAAGVVGGIVTLGPGRRVGLWVEGCTLACRGCMSPDLWAHRTQTTTSAVASRIIALAEGHDGLTVSGGEPFQQAEALCHVLRHVSERVELDVLLYSGYRRSELESGPPEVRELLASADLLIDGRFETDEPTQEPWRGSANQRLHVLTPRGMLALERPHCEARLQVVMESDGPVRLIGVPPPGVRDHLRQDLLRSDFSRWSTR
jgi:anaerobic ribonucleoside-triphosphate reductase activating protein